MLTADSDFYEERLEAAKGGVSALGDSAVRHAVLASSPSQPSSLANSPPLSPRAARPAAAVPGAAPAGGAGGVESDVEGGEGEKETVSFDGGLTLPAALYDRLFTYQQVGVQWMWELHMQRTGGALLSAVLSAAILPFCTILNPRNFPTDRGLAPPTSFYRF